MQITSLLAALCCATTIASSAPIKPRTGYAVKDSHPVHPKWRRSGPAPYNHVIDLQIGLTQSNFGELERHLYEVSDPSHSRYGQHLTTEEVHELIKPTNVTFDLVHQWLAENGIGLPQLEYSPAKDWIMVSLPVNVIEQLLDSEYSLFKHNDGDNEVIRMPEWSLPIHLHEHISTIQPTNSFFQLESHKNKPRAAGTSVQAAPSSPLRKRTGNTAACHKFYYDAAVKKPYYDLDCVRQLYGTKDYTPKAANKNHMGVVNYWEETPKRDDLTDFFKQYRPEAVSAAKSLQIVSVNGGKDYQGYCDDICQIGGYNQNGDQSAEYSIGITYPTNLTSYNVAGTSPFISNADNQDNTNEPYLVWANYILQQTNIPQTISTSWYEDESNVPKSYATAVCNQFAQLGARGVSLLFPSGADGTGEQGSCMDGNFKPHFIPLFPASCPYVTTVGATKMSATAEVAAYDTDGLVYPFSSGAGFSDYFAQPKWQTTAVSGYLKQIPKFGNGMFNKQGRAYPDIAALGQTMATAWDGGTLIIQDGTIISAPIAASVFALVNDALIAAGKAPLGFLNPFIYSVGNQGFTDVTVGSSYGCGSKGFPAKTGWDAVTGWGSPDFKKLVDLAMTYQSK